MKRVSVRELNPDVLRRVAGVRVVRGDGLRHAGEKVRERNVQMTIADAARSRDLDAADRAGDRTGLGVAEVCTRQASTDDSDHSDTNRCDQQRSPRSALH